MTSATRPESKPAGLLERLSSLLLREPEDREQLLELLHSAYERKLLDSDAFSIIEGALGVADLAVRGIMVARAQMDVIAIETPLDYSLRLCVAATPSRFRTARRRRALCRSRTRAAAARVRATRRAPRHRLASGEDRA